MDWGKLLDLAAKGAGFLALALQGIGAALRRRRRPRLHVYPFDPAHDLKYWQLDPAGKNIRKVMTLDVSNRGADTAKRCVATLEVTRTPPGITLRERRYALHWAGVEYSFENTGSQPVEIGPEIRRLDVAFTHVAQDVAGCWIAIPMAMSLPSIDQAYLPPGDYDCILRIGCENGRGRTVQMALRSPDKWQELAATFPTRGLERLAAAVRRVFPALRARAVR